MLRIPWTEKYRPRSIDTIEGQEEALHMITHNNSFQHFLFYGPPGTGKTTAIHAYARDKHILPEVILELNASDDRGIDVVRSKIIPFAQSSAEGLKTKKLIILDEAEAMTSEAQSALRKVIEDHSTSTMFCLLCNQLNQIIDPIISRCVQVQFVAIPRNIIRTVLYDISKSEHLEINRDLISAIKIIAHYTNGDLRNAIGRLQSIQYVKNKEQAALDSYGLIDSKVMDHYAEVIQSLKNSTEPVRYLKLLELATDASNNQYLLSDYLKKCVKKYPRLNNWAETKKISERIKNGCDEFLNWVVLFSLLMKTM